MEARVIVLICGVVMSTAGWAIVPSWWTGRGSYSSDDHMARTLLSNVLAFTFGTLFLASEWLEAPRGSSAESVLQAAQVSLMALTLVFAATSFTVVWLNRPRLLVPRRYRQSQGRWQERQEGR